jgi:NAD(P)H-hydrate repair Nnr-like enzyme with NAD(P)H-hydrate dehydratase domain
VSKNPYCKTCFRELPSDDAVCDRCVATPSAAKPGLGSILTGLIGMAVVASGMFAFNVRQCVLGAAMIVAAVLFNVVRHMR